MIHIVHTVDSLDVVHGGPSRSVAALADAVARAGLATTVLAGKGSPKESKGGWVAPQHALVERTNPVGAEAFLRRNLPYEAGLVRLAPDIVHNHGLWLPSNFVAGRVAASLRRPYVVSPRGMLAPWALAYRRWKKRLAWSLFQGKHLRRAALLHVTAASEAEDVRRLGLRAPLAIIPNGVTGPSELPARPAAGPLRRALFLSRVHPVKGLPMLIDAWTSAGMTDWELVVVGPDEEGHGAAVDAAARAAAIPYTRLASVSDEEKWHLYRSADLFVLPTYSENFGIVVAEALAAGVPVLTTTGTPWRDLIREGCGWWIEPNPQALAVALGEAAAASRGELQTMGERGRRYVEETFGWGRAGEEMAAAYRWLMGEAVRPTCVHVD